MDKAKKKAIRFKIINELNKNCDPCHMKVCENCPTYSTLQSLRMELEPDTKRLPKKKRKPKPKNIPHQAFVDLFEQGLTNREVALKLDRVKKTVWMHRVKWEKERGVQ